ncbi:ankyrin repeat-containing domain protein [Aspergillus pseudodeflectus]|uniref:Ankyrin repeat-containing domain protein n=1 Tax=Aspergillus pseudodeflectus TaxID=176178 RepID=A0ABR4KUX0_9EURO
MSHSENRSGSELGPPSVEPDTIEDLCKALGGKGVSELSPEFWTRNKGKLDTLHDGQTALSLAAQKKNLGMVETLLKYDADVNAKDVGGRTALSYAAQLLQTEMVKLLLERGANPDKEDDKGRTPVSWVASTNWAPAESPPISPWAGWSTASPIDKCLDLLKKYNANLHQHDKTGRTPLSWAAGKGLVEMVEYLCKDCGTGDAFKPGKNGRSPLPFAAEKQQYGVIATIVERRHSHQDFDKQNRTPLHWLYQEYHDKGGYQQQPRRTKAMENILEYLGFESQPLKRAGNQFRKDDHTPLNKLNESVAGGKTLLAYAVLNNYEELIDALWSRETGISPDIPNSDDGKTARVLALEQATIGQTKFIKHPLFRKDLETAIPAIIQLRIPSILECLLGELPKHTNERSRVAGDALWIIFDDASDGVVLPLLRRLFEVLDAGATDLTQNLRSQKKRLELALGRRPNARELVQTLLENGLDPSIWTRPEDWFERWAAPNECLVKLSRKGKEAKRSSFALEYATGKTLSQEVPDDLDALFMSHKTEAYWGETRFVAGDRYTTHEVQLDFQGLDGIKPCGDDKGIEQPTWGIRWMMKPGADQAVVYESTLRKVWIPDDITDFFTQFLLEFDEKWQAYCDTTNGHLDKHRRNAILNEEGTDQSHLTELAGDIYYLSALRGALHTQVRTIQQGIKEAFDNEDESFRKLHYQLREYKAIYNEHLDRYENLVNTLLQLEYTRHSVQEAGRVNRISSITFIYLPLMFVSSLFGMNIDVLKDNPGWYWYLLFAVLSLGTNQIIHQYLKEQDNGFWHRLLSKVGLRKSRPVQLSV